MMINAKLSSFSNCFDVSNDISLYKKMQISTKCSHNVCVSKCGNADKHHFDYCRFITCNFVFMSVVIQKYRHCSMF